MTRRTETLDDLMKHHPIQPVLVPLTGLEVLRRIRKDRNRIRAEVVNDDMLVLALDAARALLAGDALAPDSRVWLTQIAARLAKVQVARRRVRGR